MFLEDPQERYTKQQILYYLHKYLSEAQEQCYDNIRISKNAWDTNLVKANPQYLSVNWEASGGGAFAVIPLNEKGRLPEQIPLFRGHKAVVLDTDWNPFDDSLIASGSDDGKAFIWRVPEDFALRTEEGEDPKDVGPLKQLTGHSRKVGHVLFNPAAANVLATSSGDYTVKIWDVEAGSPRLTLRHTDIVQSLSWSANGSLVVTTSRDKKLRIWDVRQEAPAHTVPGHAGAKNSRVTWMGEQDRIATTGFSKMSDRQLGLWDLRDPKEPVGGFHMLDSISGVCMPFWDEATKCLYLAGKGDGNIRYFEYERDRFEYLSEYKSGEPQRGVAFLPKRGVNMHENEVMRAFKTVNDSYIEPISFIVPRRAEVFQGDIYPPVVGTKPAMSAAEWFDGMEGLPPKIDLESIYEGEEPAEIPADSKPVSRVPSSSTMLSPSKQEPSPASSKEAPEPIKEPPQPSPAFRGPPPSIKEQSNSIANLASKYEDDKEDSSSSTEEDDSSSFEEVPKPIERQVASSSSSKPADTKPAAEITEAAAITCKLSSPVSPTKLAAPVSPSKPASSQQPPLASSSATSPGMAAAAATTRSDDQVTLKDIKVLLERQSRTISGQSEKIAMLTAEVDRLKTTIGEKM
ncbi:MAG: hypothetical protein LQ341_002445 [Variospora aurantia]|nr:MAG: hypothetical protein LQ341_002445 [Variospora aurantia]